MGSLLIETAGGRFVDGLWSELAKLGGLWLQLVSWLVAEDGRALAALSAPLTPWLVLLLIVAGRALFPARYGNRLRTQRPSGGIR